ncbi:MAG: hypothetical protein AB7I18_01535 [Candidatus Berkiella sp.]
MSLHQSSSSSQEYVLLRVTHFEQFYRRITQVLDGYVTDANRLQKDGWQEEAVNFYQELSIRLRQGCSLLDLKKDLLVFCEKLRSPFNLVINTVVGSVWAEKIGNAFNAPGSSLRAELIKIAHEICPLAACYILEEIGVAKQKPICVTSSAQSAYISFNLHEYDHEHLSQEGLRVLHMICSDDHLMQHFLFEAKENQWNINAESLVAEYKKSRRKRIGLF